MRQKFSWSDAALTFIKARQVPLAHQDLVEEALDELVHTKIIELVQHICNCHTLEEIGQCGKSGHWGPNLNEIFPLVIFLNPPLNILDQYVDR